jgi:hypothetical protein
MNSEASYFHSVQKRLASALLHRPRSINVQMAKQGSKFHITFHVGVNLGLLICHCWKTKKEVIAKKMLDSI